MRIENLSQNWNGRDLSPVFDFATQNQTYRFIEDLDEIVGVEENRNSLTTVHNQAGEICGLFLVDTYQNLWFDIANGVDLNGFLQLALPIAFRQSQQRFDEPGLDSCEFADQKERIQALQKVGFLLSDLRTRKYGLNTRHWKNLWPVPEGFTIRSVHGEEEIPDLVALHRGSFESDEMTEEYRLAMMRVEHYEPELDLVMEDEKHSLIAFCVCGTEHEGEIVTGYTDPVGVLPAWHRKGIGKCILAAGVEILANRGIQSITLGTSSENTGMQKLAEAIGFNLTEEKIWLHLADLGKPG